MNSSKFDQICDYLHVDSSIQQKTPFKARGDGIFETTWLNNHSSTMNGMVGIPPGSVKSTSPLTRARCGHCDGTSGYMQDTFYQGNNSSTQLDPHNLSYQSHVPTSINFPFENGTMFSPPVQQHGSESLSNNSQGVIAYLHGLLSKSEAVQSTLHSKVKDAYKIIQNQTEQLLKSECEMKLLSDELEKYKKICEKSQVNEKILKMENDRLVSINQKNNVEQNLLQHRITELQKDIQSIWSVHNALQAENEEKQIILEKTLHSDLFALESERDALMKRSQRMSEKGVELEKSIQEASMKLRKAEEEKTRLYSEKQLIVEEKELVIEAHEQLKLELTICQQLCEKLIAEKNDLIQRKNNMKSESRKQDISQEKHTVCHQNNNNISENITTNTLFKDLCTLPFVKVSDDNDFDVVTKIKEYVGSLQEQINNYKEQLERCQQLLEENKDRLAKQTDIMKCERAEAETESSKNAQERNRLELELKKLQKERTKWKVDESELTLCITEMEAEKANLEKIIEEKNKETCLLQRNIQEQRLQRDNTISSLQEKLKTSDSDVHRLRETPIKVMERRSLGTQTSCIFEPRSLRRRHSEGCIQTNARDISGQSPCLAPNGVLEMENLNTALREKLEDSEKERLRTQEELEQVIQHFKDAFDEQIAKELDEERENSEARERELLSELEKQRKECQDRREHSIFVSKAYQKLQGEFETLWQEKEGTSRRCESLEFERNQLREQVEELCRSHSEDEKPFKECSSIGKKKVPSSKPQSPLPRKTEDS